MGKKGNVSQSPKSPIKHIHEVSLNTLLRQFETNELGLGSIDAEKRLQKHGKNQLTQKKETPLVFRFLLQFKNFFSILLLTGSALSFLGEWLAPNQGYVFIAWALLGVTLLNAVFTFIQEYKTEQAMKSFAALMTAQVVVYRDGQRTQIDSVDIVPGDIIELSEGDKIVADARLIEQHNLKVDHAALTGESEPQLRSIKPTSKKILLSRNMVFSGTLVQQGTGKAVIIATGDNTQIGKIAKETQDIGPQTSHLQKEIMHFIKVISRIAIVLGVLFFGIGLLLELQHSSFLDALIVNLVFAIGIIVANVPEGLLPTVTLTLSIAAQKLAKQQVLIKNIDAIETIGNVTVICSDKTGTLTENNLAVGGIYLNGVSYDFDKMQGVLKRDGQTVVSENISGFTQMLEVCGLCNNANFTEDFFGDPLDVCLGKFVQSFTNISHLRSESPRKFELPFSSETKYMAVSHIFDDGEMYLLKGAPEVVIEKCTKVFKDGKIVSLSKSVSQEILAQNTDYAKKGYRVLALAQKKHSTLPYERGASKNDYIFYGLVFMQDPPRKEVPKAVALTHQAGIRIIVISGDQGVTVASIAQQVGILNGEVTIIEGDEISTLSDSELCKVLRKPNLIFARALPKDKLRIVTQLKHMGEIVAVTGDGVNDAPAIKRADVGIAMGKSGTEVAKEASDIILLDDNFASITRAIKFGRTIYDNIKHFITYILTSNTPEIIPFLVFVVFGWPLALPTLLILAIDLGTDMLPAIALGLEKPTDEIMKRKPRSPKSKLLTWNMIGRSYGFVGLIQTIGAYVVFFSILFSGGWSWNQDIGITDPLYLSAVAGFFMTVVVTQIFNLFSCRTSTSSVFSKPLFSNKVLWFGIGSEILLLCLLIGLEPLRIIFGLSFFDWHYVWYAIGFGVLILAMEEVRKYFVRTKGRFGLD